MLKEISEEEFERGKDKIIEKIIELWMDDSITQEQAKDMVNKI